MQEREKKKKSSKIESKAKSLAINAVGILVYLN